MKVLKDLVKVFATDNPSRFDVKCNQPKGGFTLYEVKARTPQQAIERYNNPEYSTVKGSLSYSTL